MNCPGINYSDMNYQEWICGNELSGNEPSFKQLNVEINGFRMEGFQKKFEDHFSFLGQN